MEQEIWKPVVGYEGFYEVSNMGNVRSIDRITQIGSKGSRFQPMIILKKAIRNGYHSVMLSKENEKSNTSVHRIVALAFIDNPLQKTQVNHINSIKTDNRVENLEWATPKENTHHSMRNGNHFKGSRHGNSVLKEKDILHIYKVCKNTTDVNLSQKYSVNPSTIRKIRLGMIWKELFNKKNKTKNNGI